MPGEESVRLVCGVLKWMKWPVQPVSAMQVVLMWRQGGDGWAGAGGTTGSGGSDNLRTSNRLHPRLRGTVLDDIVSCGYMAWYQFFSIQTRVYSFI